MVKTIEEFKEEIRAIREELYQNVSAADIKLIASYLDRLIISLEGLSESLELTIQSVETLSESESWPANAAAPAAAKTAPAKAVGKAKNKAKKAVVRKRPATKSR